MTDAHSKGRKSPSGQKQETSDNYAGVIAVLSDGWRVIICKDGIQWILQRRKKGGAQRPWRGQGYFRTRRALLRVCATSCDRIDPCAMAALVALPEWIA